MLTHQKMEELRMQHWLVFDAKRRVIGCHCGFPADMESDCGWGDSVANHLMAVGGAHS